MRTALNVYRWEFITNKPNGGYTNRCRIFRAEREIAQALDADAAQLIVDALNAKEPA